MDSDDERVGVCFVCLGNICRSPTAEAVFTHLVQHKGLRERFVIESAGTSGYHNGESPDRRSAEVAARRGISLLGSSQQFTRPDFDRFDYVVAMDSANERDLRQLAASAEQRSKITRLRDYDEAANGDLDVPDPYYGGPGGFDDVLDICERGCQGLLAHLQRTHEF